MEEETDFLNQGEYHKPNSTIQTKNFGVIRRDVYKSTIEILTLKGIIDKKIKEFNLPFKLEMTTDDNSFFKNCMERYKDKNLDGLTEEQIKFEFIKAVLIQNAVDSTDTRLNR